MSSKSTTLTNGSIPDRKNAYATLLTRGSYLAGVLILAYTLQKQKSKYPLIVCYTSSLSQECVSVLYDEAERLYMIPHKVETLLPAMDKKIELIAARFKDTWTKLRVFELFSDASSQVDGVTTSFPSARNDWDEICFLDADMAIFNRSMDGIFEAAKLPGPGSLAACNSCVCNLDKDPWAPQDWIRENCAYSIVQHPDALTKPTPVTNNSRPTHKLLNGGMFVFRPSKQQWDDMMVFFEQEAPVESYKFPDQDFLADFFKGRWQTVGWQYNALKTMRYWHQNIWRDEEVVCLHYIVDKPWAKRIAPDGTAGYLGRDGETHKWWWQLYDEWKEQRERFGDSRILDIVSKYVAARPGEEREESEDMRAIGAEVQGFANNQTHRAK